MLIQLTYASRANTVLGPGDIKDILQSSAKNNGALGVTAMLCLSNGIFLQQLAHRNRFAKCREFLTRRSAEIAQHGHVLTPGRYVGAEEVEDNDQLHLARIGFNFNRRDYGRLRQLIDVLNEV